MDWFKPTITKRSQAERIRRAKDYTRQGTPRSRKPMRIRPENHVFFKTFSQSIWINGQRVKVCTRYSIAKFFDVNSTTVLRWGDRGILPEPFYHIPARGGIAPVYLASQVLVLRKVIGDLVRQGYITVPWSKLTEHVDMLKEGYEAAAIRAYKKFEASEEIEKADRFGVVFY